jgi:hypothetical protein
MGWSVLPEATVSRRQEQARVDSEPAGQVHEGRQGGQGLARLDLRDVGAGVWAAQLGLAQAEGQPRGPDPPAEVHGKLSIGPGWLFSQT